MDFYLIWSHEHQGWWGPARISYTTDVAAAGRYYKGQAEKIVQDAALGWHPGEDGSDALPHEVMVLEKSRNMISAVCAATVAMVQERMQHDEAQITP